MHIHLGVMHVITTFLSVIIAGTIWRIVAAHLSDKPIGQAMSFMY